MDFSNQWEREGKCQYCRRQNYCSKRCRANKVGINRLVQEHIGSALMKKFIGVSLLIQRRMI